MKGFAELQTATDLRRKLEHDLGVLEADPADVYAAFNFFVTAEHILDWLYPGGRGSAEAKQRTAHRESHQLLKVVSHIANGAKHFILESKRHDSVQHVDQVSTTYGTGEYGAGPYGGRGLLITLEGLAAEELGNAVSALDLAREVVDYWRNQDLG